MGSGKWEMGNGKWEVGNGKWEVGNGKWEVGSGKWEVGNIHVEQTCHSDPESAVISKFMAGYLFGSSVRFVRCGGLSTVSKHPCAQSHWNSL